MRNEERWREKNGRREEVRGRMGRGERRGEVENREEVRERKSEKTGER